MKSAVVIVKIIIVMSILFSAIAMAGFSDFFDFISLIFILLMTIFLTITGFSIDTIQKSLKAVFSDETSYPILLRSKEFWLSIIRNLIISGVFGTVIGFILILANLDDPTKSGPMMSVAFLTVFYGFLFTLVFPVPAYFIIIKKLKSTKCRIDDNVQDLYDDEKTSNISTFFGLFGLLLTLIFAINFTSSNISSFYNLPSILLILGGGIAFTIFTEARKENFGGYLSLGFTLAGLIGAIGGMIQMLKYTDDLTKIGPAAALSMLSLFSALIGMIFISLPMSDKYQYTGNKKNNNIVFRVSEFVLPILALIFSTIIMFMILSKL